ncbi:alpha/beta hydrolase [Natronoglycomyces albus]|uniref:Alpha/beta fold hydrolase n=1 Tax=Natronoglycomyces albus TaxID=2811108 RepID=A0A895XXH0_9ACTN|nr:alpha/beta fold hydrolase [Natronoglycomyces albus]QSB06328.1 alpha/beta fold hydrolase [Natronoglycomyces albus]
MPWISIMKVAVVIIVVGGLIVTLMWLGQRFLIYHPDSSHPSVPEGVEEISFHTEDDLELAAWRFHPPAEVDRNAAVLVVPGNAGNRAAREPLGRDLAAQGFTVVTMDYRGYGGNDGSPTEEGLYRDVRAAWDYLRKDFKDSEILLFGESLGCGVVAALAADVDPGGIVLRSPFTSLVDVGRSHYGFLPVGLLLKDRFPVTEHLEENTAPVVVIYSDADEIIPAAQSREVASRAEDTGVEVTVVTVSGRGHNARELSAGRSVIESVSDLADSLGMTHTQQ